MGFQIVVKTRKGDEEIIIRGCDDGCVEFAKETIL